MLEDSPEEAGVTFFWCSSLFWVEATSWSSGGWIRCIYFILTYFFILEKFCASNFNNNLCPFRAQKGILYFFYLLPLPFVVFIKNTNVTFLPLFHVCLLLFWRSCWPAGHCLPTMHRWYQIQVIYSLHLYHSSNYLLLGARLFVGKGSCCCCIRRVPVNGERGFKGEKSIIYLFFKCLYDLD